MQQNQLRLPVQQVETTLLNLLVKYGYATDKAIAMAHVFTSNSVDGVYTHGLHRFARFIQYVQQGVVNVSAGPFLTHQAGAMQQWDGNNAAGILNAMHCTEQAMQLATDKGIGCVALANTNHWMRGGTYGWQAAKKGFAFIAWTNTITNMPPYGALQNRTGNNPLVIAVPFNDEAIVLDMAMSQYSFGKIEMKANAGETLQVPGGYDAAGNATTNPAEIMQSNMALPIGYWKGSALALLLDILATILSGGLSTKQIGLNGFETQVSQVFIAIDVKQLHNTNSIQQVLADIISDYKSAAQTNSSNTIRYPGEQVVNTRLDNLKFGIPIDKATWEGIMQL